MPNTREKLIKLLSQVQDYGTKQTCEQWSVTIENKCNETIADNLIAHGVKIPVPCEDCKRHTKCLIEEQLHFVKAEERFCCLGERKDNYG